MNADDPDTERPADDQIARYDWTQVLDSLDERGFALLPALLSAQECTATAGGFDDDDLFRSHIVMRRHGFGEGEYKYYARPLPTLVGTLRETLYPPLATLANTWSERIDGSTPYPQTHKAFVDLCHQQGQQRPTPLLLRYRAGDYNRLHQDLYGDISFPLQVAVLLDRPGADFEGGELVLSEQKPRSQSRVQVVALNRGDAVVFAVNERPVRGTRGYYRLRMRHGVSEVRTGLRHTLGIIFHDAK